MSPTGKTTFTYDSSSFNTKLSENSCVLKEVSILKRYFDHITEFNIILSAFISKNSARAQLLQNNDEIIIHINRETI